MDRNNRERPPCSVIILAAGLGTRMKSEKVKVLHPLVGRPMIFFALEQALKLGARTTVLVVGHQAEDVRKALQGRTISYALQNEQLGTGHAVQQAMPFLENVEGPVLVLCGDVPLLRQETLRRLLEHHHETEAAVTLLTTELESPRGYGRIIRSPSDNILKIVEEKDAGPEQKKIREINTGTYCFDAEFLRNSVSSLSNKNVQKEYYLTDLIEIAQYEQKKISGLKCPDPDEVMGINSRDQLAAAEALLRQRINLHHMQEGVTLIDPSRTYIGMDVEIGSDTTLYPDCFLEGRTRVGSDCVVGPNTRIVDCEIENGVEIRGMCILCDATVEQGAVIGPFSHLRPGARIRGSAHIGNFVEIKNSRIGPGSKVNHLSYIGDTEMGESVNIGAGTITCNYDGVHKHKTRIGDRVFVGSDTQFVAPVQIGDRSLIAAGSTITRDVPGDALAMSRVEQKNVDQGARKILERLRKKKSKE